MMRIASSPIQHIFTTHIMIAAQGRLLAVGTNCARRGPRVWQGRWLVGLAGAVLAPVVTSSHMPPLPTHQALAERDHQQVGDGRQAEEHVQYGAGRAAERQGGLGRCGGGAGRRRIEQLADGGR